MDISIITTLVLVPVARSIAGWLENALDDGKINSFEWKQLGATVLRVGMIGFATYFGLGEMGFDVNALGAGASAVLVDFVLSAIKNKNVSPQVVIPSKASNSKIYG
jgi:hypothetical protein